MLDNKWQSESIGKSSYIIIGENWILPPFNDSMSWFVRSFHF